MRIHAGAVTGIQYGAADNAMFTSSYDSTIRKLDLANGAAVQVFAPAENEDDIEVSAIQLPSQEPHVVYFTTLSGTLGRHDMRTSSTVSSSTEFLQLHDKKIGGFSLHPAHPNFVATASLDRTVKVWDLRKISGRGDNKLPVLVGEHASRLSVSHAEFNCAGQLATTSYDDSIKLYDMGILATLPAGSKFSEEQMKPARALRHNNQVGRWVTMYVTASLVAQLWSCIELT
jgi:WD40 repeat protein